jgi:HAD superfamily hydrolase (TIGR01509 family)
MDTGSMTPRRFNAVAWDIDGTLIDSEPLHHYALVQASLEFGTDLSDLPDMAFRGVHMGDVWTILRSRFPASLEEKEWLEVIIQHYVSSREMLRPIPGAIETVLALSRLGVLQVCVSNSVRAVVDANLAAIGLDRHMGFSISLDDVIEGKPSPVPYLKAVDQLGLSAAAVMSVEDSVTGLRSSKDAGLFSAFLQTLENGSATQVSGFSPDIVVSTPSEILPLFQV